jgi:hypothetical protein
MGAKRSACWTLVGEPEGKRPLGRPSPRWVDNVKMNLRKIRWGCIDWLRIKSVGGPLWTWKWTFGVHKMLGYFWAAKRPKAFQGLCSIQFDTVLSSRFKWLGDRRRPLLWRIGIMRLLCPCLCYVCLKMSLLTNWCSTLMVRGLFTSMIGMVCYLWEELLLTLCAPWFEYRTA